MSVSTRYFSPARYGLKQKKRFSNFSGTVSGNLMIWLRQQVMQSDLWYISLRVKIHQSKSCSSFQNVSNEKRPHEEQEIQRNIHWTSTEVKSMVCFSTSFCVWCVFSVCKHVPKLGSRNSCTRPVSSEQICLATLLIQTTNQRAIKNGNWCEHSTRKLN